MGSPFTAADVARLQRNRRGVAGAATAAKSAGKAPPRPEPPAPLPVVAPAPPDAAQRPKQANAPGRDAPPIAPATVPLRWERASGRFSEQFPGAFRAVLVGAIEQWPQVEKYLREMGKLLE